MPGALRLIDPAPAAPPANEVRFLINNHPAIVTVWTAEEWARLPAKPRGVDRCPNGTYVRLLIA